MRGVLRPFAVLPVVLCAQCVKYDPLLEPRAPGPATDEDAQTCEAPPPSVDGMRAAACPGGRCSQSNVVRYWQDVWDEVDIERTMTFEEGGGGTWALALRDENGTLVPWELEVGRPVTLIVTNPTSASAAHDLTAPLLFRKVAWREIQTSDARHRAASFDTIELHAPSGGERTATLRFVPLEPGTYSLWSSQGVVNGDRYAEILDGTVTPDFGTGDAGQGMKVDVVVSGTALRTFLEGDPDRGPNLDRDARRRDDHAVWQTSTEITIDSSEALDEETGANVFRFVWSTTVLTRDQPYRLRFANPLGNEREHSFSAPALFRDSVLRAVADSHVRLRLSQLENCIVKQGAVATMDIVPTVATTYTAYCRQGVVFGGTGHPDLATGHPSIGMLDHVTVAP